MRVNSPPSELKLVSTLAASSAVIAQPLPATLVPAAQVSMLRSGTPITLRTTKELTTEGKMLKVGRRFNLEVAEPVSVNGQVVVPVGARAIGEVTEVLNKGMWGKSGGINARLVSVQVGDRMVRLSGQLDDKGKTGTVGVVASLAVIPVAGFFVTGTSARIPLGSNVSGFTDEDLPLQFVATAPAAAVVMPATAPPSPASPVVAIAPAPTAAKTPVVYQGR